MIAGLPVTTSFSEKKFGYHWLKFLRSPLCLCLIGTLLVRIGLVIYTHGIIDGDEALVGIQAEHILQGEHFFYFYAQPYMGTLETYFIALIFALTGPSTWAMHTEPILLSMLIVILTWIIAGVCADTAKLPPYAKRSLMIVAALCATFPPLYDVVIELRTYGGYIETFIIELLILLTTLRLTQRWQVAAPARDLALHWALLGFLIGLGCWIYPLILNAVLAAGIWIAGYCIVELARSWVTRNNKVAGNPRRAFLSISRGLLLGITAIPAALLGFAPGLDWGLHHNWDNIRYIFQQQSASTAPGSRLTILAEVTHLYTHCSALRVIGGSLPTDYGISRVLTIPLVVGLGCIAILISACLLSLFWKQELLLQTRRLALPVLLFAGCSALIFCISSAPYAPTVGLTTLCGSLDPVGRYATPLMLLLPFCYAIVFTMALLLFRTRQKQTPSSELAKEHATHDYAMPPRGVYISLSILLAVFLATQLFPYIQTRRNYTFQTSGCTIAPANNDPIIAYMQKEHIHYAWASGWVGNVITFKTNGAITVVDPRQANHSYAINRIPKNTDAVLQADRASLLLLAAHDDLHPQFLQSLDQAHITYRTARFLSAPDANVDLIVITPLNQNIPPPTLTNILGVNFRGC